MQRQFTPGDLVKLKISNQVMSIKANAVSNSSGDKIIIPDKYECVWYDGDKYQKAVFAAESLELVHHLVKD